MIRWKNTVLAIVGVAVLVGCQPVDPTPISSENDRRTGLAGAPPYFAPVFYPLRIGNTWRFDATARLEIIALTGPPPPPPRTLELVVERRLIGLEEFFGRNYVVEQEVVREVGESDSLFSWIRFRQDQKGLYEADVWIGQPPASIASGPSRQKESQIQYVSETGWFDRAVSSLRLDHRPTIRRALAKMSSKRAGVHDALGRQRGNRPRRDPGGVLDDELTRLQYPLRTGDSWSIRPNPQFVMVVEGVEVLQLPAGRFRTFRVRIDGPDPSDSVYIWMGRCGRVKTSIHLETMAMDPFTGQVVIIVDEWDEELTGVDIDVPGHCDRGP